MEDLHRFMRDELGAVIPQYELSKVEIHRINASLAGFKDEFTLEDISGGVSAYIAGMEELVRKYG